MGEPFSHGVDSVPVNVLPTERMARGCKVVSEPRVKMRDGEPDRKYGGRVGVSFMVRVFLGRQMAEWPNGEQAEAPLTRDVWVSVFQPNPPELKVGDMVALRELLVGGFVADDGGLIQYVHALGVQKVQPKEKG